MADESKPPKPMAAPTCSFTCPQVNDSVAPTFSPYGLGPAGANVTCGVAIGGGFGAKGVVDNGGNWQVQFNNLPQGATQIGARFTDNYGTLLCTVAPFNITIAAGGNTC